MSLCFTIDNKLTWKTHIRHKVSKSLSMINQAKHVPDYNTLHTLYCSLPYLTYCVEVWGNNYNNSLQSLLILQKKGYTYHTQG